MAGPRLRDPASCFLWPRRYSRNLRRSHLFNNPWIFLIHNELCNVVRSKSRLHVLYTQQCKFITRVCVNPSSWLPQAVGACFTQSLRDKYALHSRGGSIPQNRNCEPGFLENNWFFYFIKIANEPEFRFLRNWNRATSTSDILDVSLLTSCAAGRSSCSGGPWRRWPSSSRWWRCTASGRQTSSGTSSESSRLSWKNWWTHLL